MYKRILNTSLVKAAYSEHKFDQMAFTDGLWCMACTYPLKLLVTFETFILTFIKMEFVWTQNHCKHVSILHLQGLFRFWLALVLSIVCKKLQIYSIFFCFVCWRSFSSIFVLSFWRLWQFPVIKLNLVVYTEQQRKNSAGNMGVS